MPVDLPSGLGDSFRPGFPALQAHWTLTIGLPKLCLYLPAARGLCGDIRVVPGVFPAPLLEDPAIPGERLATIGADRVYVEQDQWQQTVLDYMDRARFVVLQAAGTPGFVWEVRKVLDRVAPEKILFCLSNFRTRQNDYEDFRLTAESTGPWRFPRSVGNQDEPQFLFFDADRTPRVHTVSYRSPVLWPVLGEVTDLHHTLAGFVDRSQGPAVPYQTKRYPGHALLAVLLFLTVMPMVWTVVMLCALLISGHFFSTNSATCKAGAGVRAAGAAPVSAWTNG